jgi:hypothetical protein
LSTTNPTLTGLGFNLGLHGERSVTTRLSDGMAFDVLFRANKQSKISYEDMAKCDLIHHIWLINFENKLKNIT